LCCDLNRKDGWAIAYGRFSMACRTIPPLFDPTRAHRKCVIGWMMARRGAYVRLFLEPSAQPPARSAAKSPRSGSVVHLLDTNTCIYAIRRRPPGVLARLNALNPDAVAVSVVVAMELEVSAMRAQAKAYAPAVKRLLAELNVLPLPDEARGHFARVKCDLMTRGLLIGPMDLLVAAHALALNATLVTNNEREFRRVKGLKLENWSARVNPL
jgi:tRNA(fMet)-specific endonuclease VapC